MLLAILGIAFAGCGGSTHKAATSASTTSTTSTAPPTEAPLQTLRCPTQVELPGHSDYAGKATVFIVGAAPKQSGCGLAQGFVVDWVKGGAVTGGYAAGSYVGYRCDGGLTVAATGPLGDKSSNYSGAIHCAQVDESAAAGTPPPGTPPIGTSPPGTPPTATSPAAAPSLPPELQLSTTKSGIWAYYGAAPPPPPAPSGRALAAAGSLDPRKLLAALNPQIALQARVKTTSLSCPPLPRARGAKVTCKFAGTDLDTKGQVNGSAEVTVQDNAGHGVAWTYQYTEGAGGAHGTGYDFDPVTGKVF
jgi:hypothetical protein